MIDSVAFSARLLLSTSTRECVCLLICDKMEKHKVSTKYSWNLQEKKKPDLFLGMNGNDLRCGPA